MLFTRFIRVHIKSPKKAKELKNIPRDIVFQLAYPRLDEKVSTDMKHLLKSPFCIHPKTGKQQSVCQFSNCYNQPAIHHKLSLVGRVCVPIPIESCESFDPTSPPTIRTLVEELHKYDATGDKPKVPGKRHSVRPCNGECFCCTICNTSGWLNLVL
jgi:DNA primase small subunit